MTYRIIRSSRKTLSLEVTPDGVCVRAPYRVPAKEIDRFVSEHAGWIEKQEKRIEERKKAAADAVPLTKEEIRSLADAALRKIPERVRYYAPLVGVKYGRITIRAQKTKWGSCSTKGNLNFNCLLMLAPDDVIDSVVVHELCHLREMNHSKRFYDEVLRVFPDYSRCEKWLKDNGRSLFSRLPKQEEG